MKDRLLVLMEALVHQRKSLVLILVKPNTKCCLSLNYNGANSYFFVNGIEIFNFKANDRNVNFLTQVYLGSVSNVFGATESREVSLKGNLYDFSFDYNAIDKSDVLNIQKYLMVKNNIK